MKKLSAGEVLTLPLIKRVSKASYQFGGFDYTGVYTVKWHNGKMIKTLPVVEIPAKFIKRKC